MCGLWLQDVKEFSLLFVGVTLTPAGLEQYDKVVEVVMHYVAMLNQKGCQQWVFDECKAVSHSPSLWEQV